MGDDNNDIHIAGQVIGESTKISLTVKTILWIIGAVITLFSTLFTLAYVDIKSDVKSYKEQADKDKTTQLKAVDDKFNAEVEKMNDNYVGTVKDIEDIKGNIKVILDRTSGNRATQESFLNSEAPPAAARK